MGRKRVKGFTLVELLVVIGIIAMLISILLPALNKAKTLATAVACQANMKQLATGVIMYATDNHGYYPSNDGFLPFGANWYNVGWWMPNLVGKYVANTYNNPFYTNSRALFCPAVNERANTSTGMGFHTTDFGIGYNCATSIRDNYLYYRYPGNVQYTDPMYASDQQSLDQSTNSHVTRLGKTKRSADFLLFTDVSGGTLTEGGYRFVQLYNGAGGGTTAVPPNIATRPTVYGPVNPSLEAVSYRHGMSANVAFLDGHVEAFRAKTKDDFNMGTHKDEGIDAAWKAGRIVLAAN